MFGYWIVDRKLNTYIVLKEYNITKYSPLDNTFFDIKELSSAPFKKGEKVWLQNQETIKGIRYGYVKTYTLSQTRRWGYIPMRDLKKAP
jgi:hypothetical protein